MALLVPARLDWLSRESERPRQPLLQGPMQLVRPSLLLDVGQF